MRRLQLVFVAWAVCMLLAPGLASARRPRAAERVPQGFVGVNLAGPLFPPDPQVALAQQVSAMVSAGVESLRVSVDWSSIQPYRSWSDVPDTERSNYVNADGMPLALGQLDQLVQLSAEHALSLMVSVVSAPPWDAIPAGGAAALVPRSNRPYADLMKALAHRYGSRGSFWRTHSAKLPVRLWQIWNEPNLRGFWSVQPFEKSYVALLRAAHDAIKAADPSAKIVLAGMVNASFRHIAAIYKMRNARRLFDVVGVHPYTRYPSGVITLLNLVRKVMNAAGDTRKPIVADEVGWNSSSGRNPEQFGIETNEAGQAANVATLLPMLARNRARLGLLGFDYFDWAGAEGTDANEFDFAGLWRYQDGQFTAKPAFSVFRHGALGLERCRVKGPVATRCATPG